MTNFMAFRKTYLSIENVDSFRKRNSLDDFAQHDDVLKLIVYNLLALVQEKEFDELIADKRALRIMNHSFFLCTLLTGDYPRLPENVFSSSAELQETPLFQLFLSYRQQAYRDYEQEYILKLTRLIAVVYSYVQPMESLPFQVFLGGEYQCIAEPFGSRLLESLQGKSIKAIDFSGLERTSFKNCIHNSLMRKKHLAHADPATQLRQDLLKNCKPQTFKERQTIDTIRRAAQVCHKPQHYACLMRVLYDHGVLIGFEGLVSKFVRFLLHEGIIAPKDHETKEACHKRLTDSVSRNVTKMTDSGYRSWTQSMQVYSCKTKCEEIASYLEKTMTYQWKA